MKFSMKKDSPFRNNIFPWLIYGFGTGFYISLLLVKMIKRPELLSPWITILLAAAGIAWCSLHDVFKKESDKPPSIPFFKTGYDHRVGRRSFMYSFDSDFPLDLLALYFPVRNECRLLLYLYS